MYVYIYVCMYAWEKQTCWALLKEACWLVIRLGYTTQYIYIFIYIHMYIADHYNLWSESLY